MPFSSIWYFCIRTLPLTVLSFTYKCHSGIEYNRWLFYHLPVFDILIYMYNTTFGIGAVSRIQHSLKTLTLDLIPFTSIWHSVKAHKYLLLLCICMSDNRPLPSCPVRIRPYTTACTARCGYTANLSYLVYLLPFVSLYFVRSTLPGSPRLLWEIRTRYI